METNVNKSETTTKKWCDEWLDGEGIFHRKIVIETVTDPINTRQAIGIRVTPINLNIERFPGLWGDMQIPKPKNFFGNNMSDKPLIDFKDLMEKGKRFLEASGMKLEDFFREGKENKEPEKSAEELVNEVKTEEGSITRPKQEVKPLKIVYNKENPLNQDKEVKPKCQKKKQKTMKQKTQKMKIQKK